MSIRLQAQAVVVSGSRRVLSGFLRAVAALLIALSLYLSLGWIAQRSPSHLGLDAKASFLAVGDTGKVHRPLASLLEGQVAVANGLAAEDRAHPVDAMLLLGDNFYMHGLAKSELVERIDQNLAYPYCHFVELAGLRSAEIAAHCPGPSGRSSVRPIYALLGNHDLAGTESAALQRDAIPQFVSNWELSTALSVNREIGGGLSLILFDSESYARSPENQTALAATLRAAPGPFRVLAAHTPMSIDEEGGAPDDTSTQSRLKFQRWVQAAIDESEVRVHLYLSGHHHSLQILEGGGDLGPALHVVAGSGARTRRILSSHPRRLYQAERLGFARVDVTRDEKLVVSLFQSPVIPLLRFGAPKLVARWSIGLAGDLVQLDLAL